MEPTLFMTKDGIPNLKLGDGNLVFKLIELIDKNTKERLVGITIHTIEPVEVGTLVRGDVNSSPLMRILSDNPKSLDILINQLIKCKEILNELQHNNSDLA